jgi:SAM-dependent methyltransferase
MKDVIKKWGPAPLHRWLHQRGMYKSYRPALGKAYAGDLKRMSPLSTEFGYDRGGPVDRYYIESFLAAEADAIRGRVLEIGDNEYSMRFGGKQITQSDILHVDDSNPQATIVGDLANAPHIPDNSFDCIVLTQTLHLIYECRQALATCYRILKPGGVLLLTSPGITPIDHGSWKDTWYWSFTELSLRRMAAEHFQDNQLELQTYGNVFVATSFLYGMGLPELSPQQLDYRDPHFPVIITLKARKTADL